jgi:predicted lipid-binding transport protein (Tim44 family)
MIKKSVAGSVAAVVIAASVSGCSTAPVQTAYGPMPQYCTQNNTATGAILGTLIGAGLGAAIGGGRGAAIGAASGLALGGVSGAQADQQCRQVALQRMVEMAAAQQAAAQQAAAQQVAANQAQAQPQVVAYEPMEYYSPSTKQRHKLTPLNTYTNPVTKETCSSFDEVSFDGDGTANVTGKGRACVGADGQLRAA